MRATYRKLCKREEFQPGWAGIVLNGGFLFRRSLHRAIETHAPTLHGIVVDFGCGQKPYRDLISADRYIGLDIPVSGHPKDSKAADVFFDGRNLPFADGSVDGVLASEVFEHVFDLPATLREIHRVLKPGGKMLLTCPFCWNEHEVPYDYARYTRFALAHLLSSAGFRVLVQEKEGAFVCALFQMALVYCHGHLRPRRGLIRAALGPIYNAIFNSLGLICERVLPPGWDFYLANVFVVEKPAPSFSEVS